MLWGADSSLGANGFRPHRWPGPVLAGVSAAGCPLWPLAAVAAVIRFGELRPLAGAGVLWAGAVAGVLPGSTTCTLLAHWELVFGRNVYGNIH